MIRLVDRITAKQAIDVTAITTNVINARFVAVITPDHASTTSTAATAIAAPSTSGRGIGLGTRSNPRTRSASQAPMTADRWTSPP